MKLILCLFLFSALLTGCYRRPAPKPEPSAEPTPQVTADTSITESCDVTGESTSFGTPIVSVQLKDGKIIWVSIDEITQDTTKKTLGDQYKMSDQAIAGWSEQVKALEEYIVRHGVDSIRVDQNGKAVNEDLKTQCTISIANYLKTVKKAVDQAGYKKYGSMK